jgi:glycosyltransferase involved in cell wall biosynthesis
MACGLPFVESQVGGVPEVADGLGGVVLVALEDVAALSSAMAKMMAAPCEGAALHGLRDRVTTRYGIADMAERVESVFDSALAGAEKP